MSDEWVYFPCQMGEHRASILYDHGIRDTIDASALRQLLKVSVAFKQRRRDGMPINEELQQLNALDDDLQALVQQHESVYVGRITVDGHRHFYIYTPDSESEWSQKLDALGTSHGYQLALSFKQDEEH